MNDLFDLRGKVAVVTGASRGIGRATAEQLAARGAKVCVSSRNLEACEAVAEGIRRNGGVAMACEASISQQAQLAAMVAQVRAQYGAIDILVCNAATNPHYGPLEGIEDEVFLKIVRNNVLSNLWLVKLVSPDMRARGGGAIVIISSIAGLKGSATIGAYGLSKAADMQLARDLAVELGAAQHPRQLHRTRPGRNQDGKGADRGPGDAGLHPRHAAPAPTRAAARDRGRGHDAGLVRGCLHHRPDPGRGRRRDDRLISPSDGRRPPEDARFYAFFTPPPCLCSPFLRASAETDTRVSNLRSAVWTSYGWRRLPCCGWWSRRWWSA